MKVLIFGSSSFAAQGLPAWLESQGHEVWTFDRSTNFERNGRALRGSYDQLDRLVEELGSCDAVVVYALVKFRNVEENTALWSQILSAARALKPARFVMISSVSVLPAGPGRFDETTEPADHPWKGEYARIKIAAEKLVREQWKDSPLLVLRPGFIVGDGILDPMVGMARSLPGGWLLGMGSQCTIIPLVTREQVHACVASLMTPSAAPGSVSTYMAVMPDPPSRKEYLAFMCRAFGRGRRTLHLPVWIWKAGLLAVSLPLSLLKRRWLRLDRTFEHNLVQRSYNCSLTSATLGVDFAFDWKSHLLRIERRDAQTTWPEPKENGELGVSGTVREVTIYGMGRIARQKHLPALQELGGIEKVSWVDPVPFAAKDFPALVFNEPNRISESATHAVITAPLHLRAGIQAAVPHHLQHILLEKPLINSAAQWPEMMRWAEQHSLFVLHNYRFKDNVMAFRRHLKAHPPGRILRTTLHFESPSPAHEIATWMRQERTHRILLTDYGLHFLDLAWIFFNGDGVISRCDTSVNARGEIEMISADLKFKEGTSGIFLRQGCHRREAIVGYDFQNYSVQLRFFPDVFAPIYGGHGAMDDLVLAGRSLGATIKKVGEKIGLGAFRDQSHERVLAAFLHPEPGETLAELSFAALAPFYRNLGRLADTVYGEGGAHLA